MSPWDSNPQNQQASGLKTYALDRAATETGGRPVFSQFKLNQNLLYSKFWNARKGLEVYTSNFSPRLSPAGH
jgi:hypothetical protein